MPSKYIIAFGILLSLAQAWCVSADASTAVKQCSLAFDSRNGERRSVSWAMTHHLNFTRQTRVRFEADGFEIERIMNTMANDELLSELKGPAFISEAARAGERYLQEVIEVTRFAIEQYGRREWSEDFKRSLLTKATKSAVKSGYSLVRKNGKTVGLMRLTFSPYQVLMKRGESEPLAVAEFGTFSKSGGLLAQFESGHPSPLPAEVSLKLRLPRPPMVKLKQEDWIPQAIEIACRVGCTDEERAALRKEFSEYDLALGVLIEPASFAIDKSLTAEEANHVFARLIEGMSEILNAFELRWGVSRAEGGKLGDKVKFPFSIAANKSVFVTYGDALSVRFYRALGYEADPKPVALANGDRGWYVLTSSGEDFKRALQGISVRLHRGGVEITALMEEIERAFAQVSRLEMVPDSSGRKEDPVPLEDRWYLSYPQ